MTEQEIQQLFENEILADLTVEEVVDKYDSMQETTIKKQLRLKYCDWLISVVSKNYLKYEIELIDFDDPFIHSLFENIDKLDRKEYFYWAFYYFLKSDYTQCKDNVRSLLKSIDFSEQPFGELDFAELLIIPFKNAFEGFWKFVANEIQNVNSEDGMVEFCQVMDLYYNSTSNDEILEALHSCVQKYPHLHTLDELLGCTYYSMSMWNNAIAYLERVQNAILFYQDEIYWMLAWSHGKVKNYAEEECYYRKCQEIYPEREFLLNNLGYCLLKQKRFVEAKSIFEDCIERSVDLPYAANNYIRLLIATERNADAKRFVKETKCHISKSLKEKVKSLQNTNRRLKNADQIIIESYEKNTDIATQNIGIKRQQFSNEKLLEEELTARLEAGIPVFGLNLRIYKRYGEYGRQYIIPVGRLDLLCEDDKGNLYVIELKKDSGYDDAYKQTAEYLEWFENSEKFKDRKIYGIICLNNPSKELIDKVHNDIRMKLYEYQISYTEL